MRLVHRFRRPHPLLPAIFFTIGAATLVFYLQYRATMALQSQTQVVVRQVSEQAADDVASGLRHTLNGPIFDTLTGVNHPDLRAGRMELVGRKFAEGLEAYPHIERFFAWRAQSSLSSDVLFQGRTGGFVCDAAMGRDVLDLAARHAGSQQIYVAAEGVGRGARQMFLRLFWTDARRVEYFAVLGFVINPATLPQQLFAGRHGAGLEALLARRGGELPLQLRVSDERGAVVFGKLAADVKGVRVPFSMQFYPADDIRSRIAAGVPGRGWTIEVGAPAIGGALGSGSYAYGPTVLSLLLMLVALGLAWQAHRRSAELARMQADFVAHVSHQLKTPLALLSAATETLQMDRIRSPERLAQYLDTIRAEAQRLTVLVQRVLQFSRVQEQRTYEFERVDLGSLVRETIEAFAPGLAGRQVVLDVRATLGAGPYVLADPAALEQVIANLLDNAIKYSRAEQPVTVTVSVERQWAIIEVTDRGVGIAAAEQRRIFERFYRVPGTGHRQGFGLGLPIVRELVHAQGGSVGVRSALGAGSTFRVMLRCVTDAAIKDSTLARQPETV
ncbi:MAG: HAMP domain-containing histidine kinase [Cyanobacteria bacterium]|nr:HAMP domain-containing histidine kinase [Cyanobacteriota bacterium]